MLPPDAVWFITGCSSGLGRAWATHIASHPTYRLVATARDPSTLTSLLAPTTSSTDDKAQSQRILTLPLDVTSATSITHALDAARTRFGRVDVLLNNAGITAPFAPAELTPEATLRDVMEVNFWGPVRLMRGALGPMRGCQRGGMIINVSSVGGRVAYPAHAAYHASKFALEGFSEALASEMEAEWGVRVVVLELGGVRSGFVARGLREEEEREEREEKRVVDGGDGGDDGNADDAGPYANENGPVAKLVRALRDPGLQERCVEPEMVVKAALEAVEGREVLPLRLVLGKDAFEAIWAKETVAREELVRWKDVSCAAGGDAVPKDEDLS